MSLKKGYLQIHTTNLCTHRSYFIHWLTDWRTALKPKAQTKTNSLLVLPSKCPFVVFHILKRRNLDFFCMFDCQVIVQEKCENTNPVCRFPVSGLSVCVSLCPSLSLALCECVKINTLWVTFDIRIRQEAKWNFALYIFFILEI